jgi:hypothetical protein
MARFRRVPGLTAHPTPGKAGKVIGRRHSPLLAGEGRKKNQA